MSAADGSGPDGLPENGEDGAAAGTEAGVTYKVGYSRPPREHRFVKGRSGNPRGRRTRHRARA